MKCCVSTHVGTWTNWLTFEPDPDYSPDAGTGLLSAMSFNRCCVEFYVGKIPRIRIGGPALQRGVVFKWFYSLSRRITFVGDTFSLPSALLVCGMRHTVWAYEVKYSPRFVCPCEQDYCKICRWIFTIRLLGVI